MQIDKDRLRHIVKQLITGIVVVIFLLLTAIGVISSDFNKIKKFDASDNKNKTEASHKKEAMNAKVKHQFHRAKSMKIELNRDNSIANLGEFTFNISEDKKLIANISIKYKAKKSSWFSFVNDKNIKEELLKKSVILRDATIDTMIGNANANANSKQMRADLKNNINEVLVEGEIEEVYFNKFIIQ